MGPAGPEIFTTPPAHSGLGLLDNPLPGERRCEKKRGTPSAQESLPLSSFSVVLASQKNARPFLGPSGDSGLRRCTDEDDDGQGREKRLGGQRALGTSGKRPKRVPEAVHRGVLMASPRRFPPTYVRERFRALQKQVCHLNSSKAMK